MIRSTASLACLALAFANVARADITLDDTPNANLVPVSKNESPPMLAASQMEASKNGRFVMFTSAKTDLVPGVDNGKRQVFVLDTVKKSLRCVSLAPNGAEFDDSVVDAAISDNGRFVAFSTRASNTGVMFNGFTQVFLQDLKTGKRTLCSTAGNLQGGNLDCDRVEISSNGKTVAFRSRAGNLASIPSNGKYQLFTFDVKTGQVQQCSKNWVGGGADQDIDDFAISGDGKALAFATLSHNLLALTQDAAPYSDVFVYDRKTDLTSLVTKSPSGQSANESSIQPTISKDGRYVGFIAVASNLVAGDDNGHVDGFFHDRTTGTTTRCDAFEQSSDGLGLGETTMSNDGRYMVAQSFEYIVVVSGGDFSTYTARVFDRVTGSTVVKRLKTYASMTATDTIRDPIITPDGKKLLFSSESDALEKPSQGGIYTYWSALDS